MLQMDRYIFTGEYKDIIGTDLIFEKIEKKGESIKGTAYQGVGSARDTFRGSGFILQMGHNIILLFSKCYENT